jgi:hypothetical protein
MLDSLKDFFTALFIKNLHNIEFRQWLLLFLFLPCLFGLLLILTLLFPSFLLQPLFYFLLFSQVLVQLCKFFGAIRSHPYLKFQKYDFTFDFSLFNCFESLQKSEVATIEWFFIEESIGCDVVCSMVQLIEV